MEYQRAHRQRRGRGLHGADLAPDGGREAGLKPKVLVKFKRVCPKRQIRVVYLRLFWLLLR